MATFNGSFSGASGTVSDHGFYYKKSTDSEWSVAHLNGTTTEGAFSATVSGLDEGTTYLVKAWVEEMDQKLGYAVDRFGEEVSFTTAASGVVIPEYLSGYGIPDVSGILSGTGAEGRNTSRDDHWFRYNTTNSQRQIAVHTYTHPTSKAETLNYVVLYDGSKYAPLWTAHAMNTTYWPKNNVGRNDDWTDDPAISLTQQSGLDNAGSVGYSRGHLVASSYRQSSVEQNKQTFYHSNQAPQWQSGFNSSAAGYSGDGVWQQLENHVVEVTPSGTTMLYVITGVLYEGNTTTKPSGSLNVPIPSHFYKCIMKCTFTNGTIDGAQGIAFVYTNVSHAGESYVAGASSIDAIEARAGFDFFANVPGNLQSSAEANTSHTWFSGVASNGNISGVTDDNWGDL